MKWSFEVAGAAAEDFNIEAIQAATAGDQGKAETIVRANMRNRLKWALFSRVGKWAAGGLDDTLDAWLEKEIRNVEANGKASK